MPPTQVTNPSSQPVNPVPTKSNVFHLSLPNETQIIHGIERVLLIFVTVTLGVWLKTSNPFSKAAVIGSVVAGGTAVYQAVLSSFTTL